MIVSAAIQKMIEFYKGNRHDVNHFLKVWAMAKTIGELEGLDRHTQEVLELAAVIPRHRLPAVPGEIRRHRRQASGAGKPGAGRDVFHRAARCAS
ncbi:MAG: hypothetical protein ACLU3I_13115 [Acutalibacteraceae bacterium]